MSEPMKPEPEDKKLPRSQIILGFVVTLIAIPVLFVATCVPFGFAYLALVPAYMAVFAGIAIWQAIRARNMGVRWGIIAALLVSAGLVIWFVDSLNHIGVPGPH